MHTFSETGAGVPAFLAKLWRLVEDPETNKLICWSQDGRSFIIQNQAQFARELLPLNYKHNNMASFIRQLNMYGFHKITSIDNGGLKFDRDEMEFTHPCFKRNCPYLLEHIKRKIASTKSVDEKTALKPEAVTKVLQDVKAMRGRQDSLDTRFSVMKQENEALWREIASLRQKHAKQQQIVNKLIQFLITIVQPQRNMTSVKRHMQLMINDIPEKTKKREASESETESGPVIHELGEELLDEVSEIEPDIMVPNSPFTRVSTPATPFNDQDIANSPHNMERPQSSISMISQNFEFSNQSVDDDYGDYVNQEVAGSDGLIQTVNNDGSKIFYHITEVPDAQPQEANISPISYNEDNVLTTPLVREEMARKRRQKRLKNESLSENQMNDVASSSSKAKIQQVTTQQKTQIKEQQQQQNLQHNSQLMQIKSEQDAPIDPMLFLNVYPNNRGLTPDPNLISPSVSDDSHQSNTDSTGKFLMSSAILGNTALLKENNFMAGSSSDFYDPNNFITNDIPADIFEDDSLITDERKGPGSQKEQSQPFEGSTIDKEKNPKYPSDPTSENVESKPSTSAAAAASSGLSLKNKKINNKNDDIVPLPSSSSSALKMENFSNMALTKYKDNQDLMRDEVSGHLDNVQDELEGLKDLLRSDVYSLDQNALLGSLNEISSIQNPKNTLENIKHQKVLPPALDEDILYKLFNDSDILGPYNLHLSNDATSNNNKKGSELMTYQPMYDLSDIINDQNDLDADVNVPTTSNLESRQQPKQEFSSSVLNTPYHEQML